MDQTLDMRGQACPIPVINAKKAIEGAAEAGTLTVLVDNETSVKNLTKLAQSKGLMVTDSKKAENEYAVVMNLTGEEILKILTTYSRGSLYHLPRIAGAVCEATIDKEDTNKDRLRSIVLKTLDGQEFDIHKTYKVVTNSYMQSACKSFISDPGSSLNIQTSVMLTNYLESLGVIKCKGTRYMTVKEE